MRGDVANRTQYAYDNMIYFHVERLSGGFVLTLVVGLVGLIIFALKRSIAAAFVFLLYIILIATYLNVLGEYSEPS
jgi:predicted lipid-binding transport protein (Tim44 family)